MSTNLTTKKRNATFVAQTEASIHDQSADKQSSPSVDQSEDFILDQSAVKQSSPSVNQSEDFIHDQSAVKQSSPSVDQTEFSIPDPSAVNHETSQSKTKSTDQNDDIKDEPFSGISNMTENLDGCFSFTLIGNRNHWKYVSSI